MIKNKIPALLTALALGATISIAEPITVHALDYKLSTNSVGWSNGDTDKVKLDNIEMIISSKSPFKLKTITSNKYDVVTDNGEILLHIDFLDALSNIQKSIVKCEKSNYVSEDAVYKDITVNEDNGYKLVSYKLDDRKYVIIVGDDSYITIESMLSDTVIFGNNYMNKFLECITVNFKEG